MTFSRTREVLWERHQHELMEAQRFDRELADLESKCFDARHNALDCRMRAKHLQAAAEALAKLDEEK